MISLGCNFQKFVEVLGLNLTLPAHLYIHFSRGLSMPVVVICFTAGSGLSIEGIILRLYTGNICGKSFSEAGANTLVVIWTISMSSLTQVPTKISRVCSRVIIPIFFGLP